MSLITKIIHRIGKSRLKNIDFFRHNPYDAQNKEFQLLMKYLSNTLYGFEHNITHNISYQEYVDRIPIIEYNDIDSYISRMRKGEEKLLTPKHVEWYAKSSGTTATKSKYIPVPNIHIDKCHHRGAKDLLYILTDNYPKIKMFNGRFLTLGGSYKLDEMASGGAKYGDLSAILIKMTPLYTYYTRLPSKKNALISDFDEKIEIICKTCINKNITSIAGVPSWNLVMLNRILEYSGKKNICEVWENMEVFVHGGIKFDPYKAEFNRLIPSSNMKYMETYNASEGFFAIQDDPLRSDMLLMLDYGVFYEFLPTKNMGDYSKVVPLEGVECGINYCMIISSYGGLWRYMIGDTVMFTSLIPHKIVITGRTKLFINVFGEEVIIDNSDKAIMEACKQTGAEISEYTAGPIFMDNKSKGSHQWLIEFNKKPNDMAEFNKILDLALQGVNSDYEAKRFNSATLIAPTVTDLPKGTFFKWMISRGKLGGQHKVPRLSNDRKYIEELLAVSL